MTEQSRDATPRTVAPGRRLDPLVAAAAAATLALTLFLGPPVSPIEQPDTRQYAAVALDLGSEWSRDRPPVYPLLIRLCRSLAGPEWPRAVVIVQVGLLCGLAASLSRLLRRHGMRPGWAVATAVASCTTPSLILYSRILLPEVSMAVLVVLAWNASLRAVDGSSQRSPVLLAGLAGLWSGAAALTKPVWLPGALPLAAGILLARGPKASDRRRAALTLVAVHAAVILSWQAFLFQRFGQLQLSRTRSIALNLAAIRLGMTHFADGTPLYRYLERAGLLDAALRLRFEDLTEFNRIKDAIPLEMRIDREFEKKAVFDHVGLFVLRQLRRTPAFFLTRPIEFGLARTGDGLPGTLRSLHRLVYAVYFRVRIGPWMVSPCLLLLLAGAVWWILGGANRNLFGVSLLCLAGFVLETVLLSFQDSTLARYRVEVEPILLTVTLLALGLGLDRFRRAASGRMRS